MTGEPLPVLVRDAEPGDVSYIVDSWVRSFHNAPAVRGMAEGEYLDAMRAYVQRLIREREPDLLVAVEPHLPQRIIGWAAVQGAALHYAVVRDGYRGRSVLRQLLASHTITEFTHCSRAVLIHERLPSGVAYKPLWLEQQT
ncbi:MAG: hypothetical protein M3Q61_04640 [Chloroflexota bacterium]|nr:hypothetical protein [Chloroflexota bacterium]